MSGVRGRGLGKRFGPVTALADVDVELRPGEILGILGPNGAGKTTLLRILAGLCRPSDGHLEQGDERVDRRRARAQVGYIGHQTLLYPTLSARENLLFAARLHGLADGAARADRLLAEQELDGVADRAAGTFSRGMAQRLAIARGLVHDPAWVLLDEPFTGLDRHAAEKLSERLRAVRAHGRAVALVTHDVDRALPLCDGALVLCRGRLIWQGRGPQLERAALEAALDAAEHAHR